MHHPVPNKKLMQNAHLNSNSCPLKASRRQYKKQTYKRW